jgi:rfaE bifunctional protein kinase chain/domain
MELFKNKNILIIGDMMLDSYLFGTVDRISPEAPVPIIDISHKENKLGGAANVAANIKNLGGNPIICSVIGKDLKGDILLSLLKEKNIIIDYIYKSNNRITTDKTRIIGNNHQMLRIDEEIRTDLNEDQEYFLAIINNAIVNEDIDCILFQDYDKGVINEYIINSIITKAQQLKIPILVDPKKKNFLNYNNVTLFKPNFKEFKDSMNIESSNKLELLQTGSKLLHEKEIQIVFVTLSDEGIFLSYKEDNNIISKIIPGISREVVDVSGAGDTVISVATMLLNEINIEEIAKISNIAGGLVCEEIGVVSIDKDKLLKEYYDSKN